MNGTLGVLRQAVQPDPDETVADLFGVTEALALLRRAEGGEAGVEELALADWTLEARLASCARAASDWHAPAETPLATLSGGQRTRAGLAALVFAEPDFILLDEPTNNLDRDGRRAVIDLLADWRAGAIVVSHDRELLETMDAIVELTSLGATRYGGNFEPLSRTQGARARGGAARPGGRREARGRHRRRAAGDGRAARRARIAPGRGSATRATCRAFS